MNVDNRPTVGEFEDFIEWLDIGEYRGEYHGRFWYEGYGVDVNNMAEGAEIVAAMKEYGINLGAWDHQDNMGLGYVIAWRKNKFLDEETVQKIKDKYGYIAQYLKSYD